MSETDRRLGDIAAPVAMVGILYAIMMGAGQGPSKVVVPPPPPPTSGAVTVQVSNSSTGALLSGAHVVLAGTNAGPSGYTNSQGVWVSPSVPEGEYLVTVQLAGYQIFQQEMALSPGQVVNVGLSAISPGPGPGAVTFVSFKASTTSCISTWNNGTNSDLDAVCWVTAKNSVGETVSLGQQLQTMQPGQTVSFNVAISPTLEPGTYEFSTFVENSIGEPMSTTHTEQDTVGGSSTPKSPNTGQTSTGTNPPSYLTTVSQVEAAVANLFGGTIPSDVTVTQEGQIFVISYSTQQEFNVLYTALHSGTIALPPGSMLSGPPPQDITYQKHQAWGVYFPSGSNNLQATVGPVPCGTPLGLQPSVKYSSSGVGTVDLGNTYWSPGVPGQIEVTSVVVTRSYVNGVLNSTTIGRGSC